MELKSPFVFVCCQPGSEGLLKAELAREMPRLRFAFSRPGFVTFKDAYERPIESSFELPSVFARAYGLSRGSCKSSDPAAEALMHARELYAECGAPLRLHVWERSRFIPGEEPPDFKEGVFASAVEASLRSGASEIFHVSSEAEANDLVFDVVVMEAESGSPLFVGFHRHTSRHHAFAGGQVPVEMPADSPSRAFVKIEQAIRWARIPLARGDVAVEVGSAPGGASFAMLLRGLEVWGIDPGAMSPVVWTHPQCEKRFHHVKKAFSELKPEDLPSSVQWLAVDINGPARVSLPYVEQAASWFKSGLLGVILTLKMNDPKHARHIPEWIEHVQSWGFKRVRATQLPANKREICLVGLTSKGLLRLQSNPGAS